VAELERILRSAQAERRLPSVSAAVFRDGAVIWQRALGLADVDAGVEATTEHAYRIGSITKTFTAVCVLQLRDQGRVELDTPLRACIPEVPPGLTVRQALAHLSGLQREPPGEIWETLQPPDREGLLAGLEDAELVLAVGERWHYSNLAFGLLGELVTRVSGLEFGTYLGQRILAPLGLERTSLQPTPPVAKGYLADPYADLAHLEPDVALTETSAAIGQLWSTTGDLASWGDVLAGEQEGVLARSTADELARVQTIVDHDHWSVGWGLGVGLYRSGDRVFAGHSGAMPGFQAQLLVQRAERTGAVVLTGSTANAHADTIALDLANAALDTLVREPQEWRPASVPESAVPLLGRWWTEGSELVFTHRGGRLQAQLIGGPRGRDTSWLEPEGPDRWRVVEGREQGELLRVVRDDAGEVAKLYFATYPVTRTPEAFAG
jgi:CubicO group peptidase (beta-lactamase class C family)